MNVIIINDCRDENAKGRQVTRAISLFKCPVSFIGVENDLEAAGNLIDTLDAMSNTQRENPGVILVNVAPRSGKGKNWENGSPFGYFWYKKILAVSSVDGLTLSLVKKLKLCKEITVLDIRKTLQKLAREKIIPRGFTSRIENSQFRSYDFLPRVGMYLAKGKKLAGEKLSIEEIPDAPRAIWWVDNFGNGKTTLLAEELKTSGGENSLLRGVSQADGPRGSAGATAPDSDPGKEEFSPKSKVIIKTKFDSLPYFSRLKDVPEGKAAIITGSSGLGDKRFLEIVVQDVHGSARKKFGVLVGNKIL